MNKIKRIVSYINLTIFKLVILMKELLTVHVTKKMLKMLGLHDTTIFFNYVLLY